VLGQSIQSKALGSNGPPANGQWDWCPSDYSVLGSDTEFSKNKNALLFLLVTGVVTFMFWSNILRSYAFEQEIHFMITVTPFFF
jgi:hypothetical protein